MKSNNENVIWAGLLLGFSAFPILMFSVFAKAYVLTWFWLWFLTEPFKFPAIWTVVALRQRFYRYAPPFESINSP